VCCNQDSRPSLNKSWPRFHGNGHEALTDHLRAVGDARLDIFPGQLRILIQDLLYGAARREEIQDQGDPDARSFDARLAETDIRLDGDAIPPVPMLAAVFFGHGLSPFGFKEIVVRPRKDFCHAAKPTTSISAPC